MGVYLSTPVRDKVSVDKDLENIRYGASSMQGWRMYQEDAHNCCPNFDVENSVSLFAVYDGHGGAEVAQYTAQHLPDFLKNLQSYKEGRLSEALEETFLGFDETLTKESVIRELKELAGVEEDEEETPESNREEAAALYEEATMPLEELLERYGGASHKGALGGLRKKDKFQSPAVRPKKDAQEGKNGDGDECGDAESADDIKVKLENKLVNGHSDNDSSENVEGITIQQTRQPNEAQAKEEKDSCSSIREEHGAQDSSCVHSTTPDDQQKDELKDSAKQDCESEPVSSNSTEPTSSGEVGDKANDSNNNGTEAEAPSSTTCSNEKCPDEPASSSSSNNDGASADGTPCGSSGQVASAPCGSSSAGGSTCTSTASSSSSGGSSSSSSTLSIEEAGPCSSSKTEEPEAGSSTGRTRKKRKTIIPEEGEDESSYDEDTSDDDEEEEEESWGSGSDHSSDEEEEGKAGYKNPMYSSDEDEEESEDEPMTGGEEPGSDSGCTSVVALLKGQELYVANAGDSRCVLCRAGKAIDMSVDHKPEDDREHSRITKAGGRVTLDGRVNGGLNLSRAIGDHCYKKNTDLSAKEQMITALPDIRCMSLSEEDEFMVLACDGIWNVMTSQDVVTFVSERLRGGVTKLSTICEEMFDFCLAPDTSGDGTGCDNMTCIILVFNNKENKVMPGAKRRASGEVESTEAEDASAAKKIKLDE